MILSRKESRLNNDRRKLIIMLKKKNIKFMKIRFKLLFKINSIIKKKRKNHTNHQSLKLRSQEKVLNISRIQNKFAVEKCNNAVKNS